MPGWSLILPCTGTLTVVSALEALGMMMVRARSANAAANSATSRMDRVGALSIPTPLSSQRAWPSLLYLLRGSFHVACTLPPYASSVYLMGGSYAVLWIGFAAARSSIQSGSPGG